MEHCHDSVTNASPTFAQIFPGDWLGISLMMTLFFTGLVASFTHCIGMCGPIAIGQMSSRLMSLPKDKVSQWSKFKCSLAMPYYFGKTITYGILLTLTYLLSISVKDWVWIKWPAVILLLLTSILFFHSGLKQNPTFLKIQLPFNSNISKFLSKMLDSMHLNSKGSLGLVTGMVLGLIPCGVVYASIITVLSNTNNYMIALISMLLFGIATIPGLLIVSFLGENLMHYNRKWIKMFYSFMMFVNSYIIALSALRIMFK